MQVTAMKLWPADRGKMVGSGWIEIDKGEIEIRVTIFTSSQGGCFASLPSKRVATEGEPDKWYPDVKMGKEFKTSLDKMVTDWYKGGRKAPAKQTTQPSPAKPSTADAALGEDELPVDW